MPHENSGIFRGGMLRMLEPVYIAYVRPCSPFLPGKKLFSSIVFLFPSLFFWAAMNPTSSEFKQELRQRLTPLQWSVTQEKGTERWVFFSSFSGGTYVPWLIFSLNLHVVSFATFHKPAFVVAHYAWLGLLPTSTTSCGTTASTNAFHAAAISSIRWPNMIRVQDGRLSMMSSIPVESNWLRTRLTVSANMISIDSFGLENRRIPSSYQLGTRWIHLHESILV